MLSQYPNNRIYSSNHNVSTNHVLTDPVPTLTSAPGVSLPGPTKAWRGMGYHAVAKFIKHSHSLRLQSISGSLCKNQSSNWWNYDSGPNSKPRSLGTTSATSWLKNVHSTPHPGPAHSPLQWELPGNPGETRFHEHETESLLHELGSKCLQL